MNPEAFDLQVAVEDPLREQYKAVSIGNPNILREISILDRKIAAVVQSVHATKLKLDFMRGFESDPVGFINKWVESQTRDLQVFYY
jgi:SWI/SNF-related matrix-associated actin-dependent regulator of chromatin subfamily D